MTILEDAKAAIQLYGKNGDNSFECFGITLEDNIILESKMYRYYTSRNETIIDWSEGIPDSLKKAVERVEKDGIIKIREIAKSNNGNGYKIYFSIKSTIPSEKHINTTDCFFKEIGFPTDKYCIRFLEGFISERLSPGRSPLLIMGIEMDAGGKFLGTKSYLSLEKFSHYTERVGEKLSFNALKGMLLEIADMLNITKIKKQEYANIGSISSRYKYYPFLIGTNQFDAELEHKLYFRVKYSGLSNDEIHYNTLNLLRNINGTVSVNYLKKIVCDFFELGLFAQGFAIGNKIGNENMLVKVYFFPLPAMKI